MNILIRFKSEYHPPSPLTVTVPFPLNENHLVRKFADLVMEIMRKMG